LLLPVPISIPTNNFTIATLTEHLGRWDR